MAAQLFYYPSRRAFNTNGQVAPGQKLYFYLAGSTTPTSVYADESLTTPLPNPVVANPSGFWPSIFLSDAIVYRVDEKTEADVPVESWDPLLLSISDELTPELQAIVDQAIAARDELDAFIADGDKGDITVSGTGATWTIDNSVVSLAKMADVATGTVFYRKTAGTGAPEVQTLATLKTDLGLTGTNSGDQTITLTGDVTGSGTGSFAATIANNAVTNAKLAQVATATLKGRTTAGTGNLEDLTAAQVRTLLNVADGATANTGTVTNVSGTGTVNGITLTGTVTNSGSLTLGGTLSGVSLTTQVTGTLPVANGGTGVTTSTGTGSVVLSTRPSFGSALAVGGATAAASGAGVTFPATQSASSDANTLDDYEEGTCTITIKDSLGNSATMGSGNSFRYVKIGAFVHVSGTLEWTSIAALTAGSRIRFDGLPFATNSASNYRAPAIIGSSTPGSFNITRAEIAAGADAGQTFIFGTKVSGNNVDGNMVPADLGSSGTVYGFQISYVTDF